MCKVTLEIDTFIFVKKKTMKKRLFHKLKFNFDLRNEIDISTITPKLKDFASK